MKISISGILGPLFSIGKGSEAFSFWTQKPPLSLQHLLKSGDLRRIGSELYLYENDEIGWLSSFETFFSFSSNSSIASSAFFPHNGVSSSKTRGFRAIKSGIVTCLCFSRNNNLSSTVSLRKNGDILASFALLNSFSGSEEKLALFFEAGDILSLSNDGPNSISQGQFLFSARWKFLDSKE